MIPTISQVCSLHSHFEKDIEEFSAGACRSVEIWLGKLETYLERHTIGDVRSHLDRHEVTAHVASFQGGLFISQEDARAVHWEHFKRRLDLCRQLDIRTLVVAGDLHGPLAEQDLHAAVDSLAQAAQLAAEFGVRLALEFQAQAAFANNLQTAAALVGMCGAANLGLCLDVFHFYLGPSKEEDLAQLNRDHLFHVQLSDLAGQPRELAADSDRILPGDGDFRLGSIVDFLRRIEYTGCVSVELMNPQIWRIPPRQFSEIAIAALNRLLQPSD